MVQDRGPVTSAVTIVMIVIATLFVAGRFFTRIYLVRSIKQDDWWMLAAWVFAVGFSASICSAVHYGLGRHKVDIPDSSFSSLRKSEYAFSILYNPALMLTKTSIIVFFLSVMSKDVDPVFKWCNWLTLAVVNVFGLALTFLSIFQCRPVAAGYLYPSPPTAKCTDIVTLYLSSAPVNIITDVALLFLPMPILTGMRLPRKQKIILVVTFSFGAFVAVVDVIRIAYLQNATLSRLTAAHDGSQSNGRTDENNDFSWYASLSFMWSAVEVSLGIICACVPSLKPLFLRFMPRFIKDDDTSNTSIDVGRPEDAPIKHLPKGDISMLNNPAAFRKPRVKEYSGEDHGDQMGFLNMLAGPPGDAEGTTTAIQRMGARLTRRSTNKSTTSEFGFVNMSGNRNMLKLSNRQSLWPIAVVTVIFFLWGFAYGLLDTLNGRFQEVVGLDKQQSLGLHAAYYGGYLVGPLTLGRFILKRYGFKATMMVGLCVYGCGTLVFWPSAVLTSYTAFIISNFIVASGLSCLEIAANPYIALCGPLEYAEVRLNLSQAFQAIGTICSPLLAAKVLFKNVSNANTPALIDVQWTYLGIAMFVFLLAIIFYYIPLPEATDEQLEELADRRSSVNNAKLGPWKVIFVTLALGVFSQWVYVGLQECVGNNLQPLIRLIQPGQPLAPFDFQSVAHTVFAAGRFLTAFLNYLFKPRLILLFLYAGLIACLALTMSLEGSAGAAIAQLTFGFEAGIFSIIFAISMRGLGAHTKTGSALMTAAISGGAVFPPIQWGVSNHKGLKYSYCVPLAAAVFGMLFPLYLNIFPAARLQVDPIHERRVNRGARRVMRQESASSMQDGSATQFGLAGIIARRRKAKLHELHRQQEGSVEHVERQSVATPTSMLDSNDVLSEQGQALEEPKPLQLKQSKGYVGALAAWPELQHQEQQSSVASSSSSSGGGNGNGNGNGSGNRDSSHSGSNRQVAGNANASEKDDLDMMITRHRPVWEQENGEDGDDGWDDYHAMMRKI
ncbi:uncharacterized protein A1O9_07930 [Exophiala aquamarina CBS 119918]|uniref:Rhodopsin domain-containing protein n=1 Tax=Exophiala aquamarina CBS 119918 TaxID=1182545 RepID=A0A072P8D9_9EURO|nr:uncharacterized protein A1O9_07930 [Exophiala aquamarina CBS 119918]KEF56349.1 hypothetical protein A1O9_07930 [Exophiala aquamarina CBS 119918]